MISISGRSKSIDRTIALAVKRHIVKAKSSNHFVTWKILGRVFTSNSHAKVGLCSPKLKSPSTYDLRAVKSLARPRYRRHNYDAQFIGDHKAFVYPGL